jgi:hypothetical protein
MPADPTFNQPWYCEKCGVDTELNRYHATMDALQVKEDVLAQHRRNSPQCPANDLPPIRFRQVERKGT